MIGIAIIVVVLIIIFAVVASIGKKGEKMNWTKMLYVLIIVLLYIPMTFLGANVFFPKYTGSDSWYRGPMDDCYMKNPYPTQGILNMTAEEQARINELQTKCQEENMAKEKAWTDAKNAYEGNKYVVVTIFNLIVLLFSLYVTLLDSIIMGLFLGSIAATFGATIRYFDTHSKIGFVIVVVTFFVMIYFINKKKDSFVDWRTKDEKKRK